MSAARKIKTDVAAMPVEMSEPPSTVSINTKRHALPAHKKKIGAKVKMTVHGKVTSVNEDKYGSSARVELSSIKHHDGEDA